MCERVTLQQQEPNSRSKAVRFESEMEEGLKKMEQEVREMEKARSQATEHSSRLQALLIQARGENSQAKANIGESQGLWMEEVASLLRGHCESCHELMREGGCKSSVSQHLGKELEMDEAKAEDELYFKFKDVEFCDGSETFRQLSLEGDRLRSQVQEMAQKNSSLGSEVKALTSQIQALQNPSDLPAVEVKRSFCEVILEGEIQSLRAQLKELQLEELQLKELKGLKAQVAEMSSLKAEVLYLQLVLLAAIKSKREHIQELRKVGRKASLASERVRSTEHTLMNKVYELWEKVDLLEQKLTESEATRRSLKEEINELHVKSRVHLPMATMQV